MKKTLIALAALASVGIASAQSTATISGVSNVQYLKNFDGSKGIGMAFTAIKFAVSEDLGGGLKLAADTELGLGNARGNNIVKRDTNVGLAGSFGSIKFSNTRTSSYLVTYGQVGTNNNAENGPYDYYKSLVSRAPVDALTYMSPSMSGFSVGAQYIESSADGITTPATKSGTLLAAYNAGPLAVGARFVSSKNDAFTSNTTKTSFDLGATYDFGVAKVGVAMDSKLRGYAKTGVNEANNGYAFGVAVPVGPVTLGLGHIVRKDSDLTDVRVNYAMSKRTSVEFNYGKGNEGSTSKTQYNLVLGHSF